MLRGLPVSNTKSVLVLTRPWALPTLDWDFGCFSWSFSLQDTFTKHHLVVRFRQHVFHVHALYI